MTQFRPRRPGADRFLLDAATAERLLSGRLHPADAPPGYAAVAELLATAARMLGKPGQRRATVRPAAKVPDGTGGRVRQGLDGLRGGLMKLSELSPAERIITLVGGLLVVDSFMPWFSRCFALAGVAGCGWRSAWGNLLSCLGVLAALAMIAQVVLARFGVAIPRPRGWTWGRLHLVAGVIALAAIALQMLVGDSVALVIQLDRRFGGYVGVLLAVGLAVGGVLRSRERA